eukprot:scaffold1356_cov123-Cylindrotheca_fusiformis.AAC.29
MKSRFQSLAERLGGVAKEKASQALEKSSSVVSNAASNAYEQGKSSARQAAQKASREVSGRVERAYEQGKTAAYDQVTSATKRASHVVRDTSSTIAKNTTAAAKEAAKEAREASTKGIRLLWWWSLAAVGIYGVATTVPRELVRHALTGSSSNSSAKKDEPVDEGEKPASSYWSSFLGR